MVSLPPGSSLGRYRIVETLGRGGMATVFRAHDPSLDRSVAIKVLRSYEAPDPKFTARFTREAQTIANLRHPNILQVYDFGEDKGFSYIVSELVTGGTLYDKLRGRSLPLDEVLRYIRPLADALDDAHSQGVIHRDIKPGNILLDAEERPILADFGLARIVASTHLTRAQEALGTPEYMSPEQALGAEADHRSDLYAFGIVIYQMLLGATPFHADQIASTMMAHVHQPVPMPTVLNPGLEPRTEATLLKALAKDPNDRFQSAGQLIEALDPEGSPRLQAPESGVPLATTFVGEGQIPVAKPSDTPAATGRPRWLRLLEVAAGVAAVAIIVVVVLAIRSGSEDKGEPAPSTATEAGAATTEVQQTLVTEAGVATGEVESTGRLTETVTQEAQSTPYLTLAELAAELQATMSRAEATVISLRGLVPDSDREPVFRTREQLESITRDLFEREDLRQRVSETGELYTVLGLMKSNQNLEEILIELQSQQVYSLFDDVDDVTYVLSDAATIGPAEELAYATAYMSGLLQDTFNLYEMRNSASEASFDQARALDAMLRGDLYQVAQGYVSTVFTRDQLAELSRPLPQNLMASAPAVVLKANRFLDVDGGNFVTAIYDAAGSWEGVNEAYRRPPVSTEQILHPEKYFTGEEPANTFLPDLSASLGRGWSQASVNTLGEFVLRTHLEEYLNEDQAAAAATGWGGDRYSLLHGPNGERLLVAIIRWDTLKDSIEFFEAYQEFGRAKAQATDARVTVLDETAWLLESPKQTTFLGRSEDSIFLVLGDGRATVGRILERMDTLLEARDEPAP